MPSSGAHQSFPAPSLSDLRAKGSQVEKPPAENPSQNTKRTEAYEGWRIGKEHSESPEMRRKKYRNRGRQGERERVQEMT